MAISETIRTLHRRGWSQRRSADELGSNRETVARHLRQADSPSKPAHAPLGSEGGQRAPKLTQATPGSTPSPQPCGSGRARGCAPWRELIRAQCDRGLSAQRLDQDLVALGVAFDDPEFFTRIIADLRAGGAQAERAQRLLHRYVPCGPSETTADAWAFWWTSERPYLFASDAGDYCWYVDPLAKKRSVPSKDLRGPRRSDSSSAVAAK